MKNWSLKYYNGIKSRIGTELAYAKKSTDKSKIEDHYSKACSIFVDFISYIGFPTENKMKIDRIKTLENRVKQIKNLMRAQK